MSEWRDISTAPREIVRSFDNSEYGEHILAYPVQGEVARVRWWQSKSEEARKEGYQNFLGDGGLACRPSHWMSLPAPPMKGEGA